MGPPQAQEEAHCRRSEEHFRRGDEVAIVGHYGHSDDFRSRSADQTPHALEGNWRRREAFRPTRKTHPGPILVQSKSTQVRLLNKDQSIT